VCVSCTLDTGSFLVFDIRQNIRQPAFQATMGKPDLHTHERYSDHHVIMGFGDGEMQHIDMRVSNRILHRQQDPYCEGIGMIDYNAAALAFVVSGFTDFTAWRHVPHNNEARAWSHMYHGTLTVANTTGFSICTSWGDDDTIVCTTSEGSIHRYTQRFS